MSGPDPCWIWTGNCPDGRYGHIKINQKIHLVHRLSYEVHVGPIPWGLWVLHKCDNPPCVNPDHLYAGTAKQNVMDKIDRCRGGYCEMHGRSVLTNSEVCSIKEMLLEDSRRGRLKQIGDRFGVNRQAIWRIHRNKNWTRLAA